MVQMIIRVLRVGVVCVFLALGLVPALTGDVEPALGAEAHLLERSLGAAGSTPSDPYPLANPTDVAVDNASGPSAGDVYVGDPSADEQQTVDVSATGGTFTLKFGSETTSALKYNAGPAKIEEALEALSGVGAHNIAAEEVSPGGRHSATIIFTGKFDEESVEGVTCDASKLQGTGASCTTAITVAAAKGNDIEKFSPNGEFLLTFGKDVNKSAVEQARPEAERNVCPAPGHASDICQHGSRTGPGAFVGEQESEFGDELSEPKQVRFSRLYLAVDGSGDLYVGDPGTQLITKFDEAGQVLSSWGSNGQLGPFKAGVRARETFHGIAVDAASDLFIWGPLRGSKDVQSFDSAGTPRSGPFESILHKGLSGLAVDADEALYPGGGVEPATNDRYLLKLPEGFIERLAFHCHGEEIEEAPCTPLEEFGMGELSDPEDVAIGPDSVVYVANTGAKDVAVFTKQPIESPSASIEAASELSFTSAHVAGTVNPHGNETGCRFEYVTDAHFKTEGFAGKLFKSEGARREAEAQDGYEAPGYAPCESNPGSGTSTLAVQADLSSLKPATTYHVRLIARSRLGAQASSEEPSPTFSTTAVAQPIVSPLEVTGVTASEAHFAAQINPNAPEAAPTSPAVEAGFKVVWRLKCEPSCPQEHSVSSEFFGEVAADNTSHVLHVKIEELQPGTTYKVTLIAKNAGPEVKVGPVEFKTATVAPQIDSTLLLASSPTESTVAAQIRAGGAPTTYRVQYIPEAQFLTDGSQFGEGTLETPPSALVAEDDQEHEARVTLTGLSAQVTYRYRFLAQNEVGLAQGPAEAFFTYAPALASICLNEGLRGENNSLALPDCRAFERVSPEGNSAVYQPEGPAGDTQEGYRRGWYPMQSASDGESTTYVGEPASAGIGPGTGNSGNGEGDEQLATRSESGWLSADITPLASNPGTYFEAFSSDLSRGILRTAGVKGEAPLSPQVETNCSALYSRASESGGYSPLFTSESSACDQPFYVGGSADGTQQVFESAAKKTEGAQGATGTAGEGHQNIYDSVGGQLYSVNVLPGGKAAPNASIGRLANEEEAKYEIGGEIVNGVGTHTPSIDTSGTISSDGSHIFWTNLATGIVYVRENPTQEEESPSSGGKCTEPELTCTVQVSAGAASYQTATPDGRFAYYTEAGQLWRFDTESGTRVALTQAGGEVQGVIGVNQVGADASYLYFVAAGDLAPGAEERKCTNGEINGKSESASETAEEGEGKAPAGRGCNLYVLHEEETKLIAVLSPRDQSFDGYEKSQGDWRATLGSRSAELTPDGSHLVFLSTMRLTPYRNATASGETCATKGRLLPCPEVYLYDASAAQLSCASCQPAGLSPISAHGKGSEEPATYLPGDFGSITHMRRWISADGDRVFFQTAEPLLPEDTNGLYDVYEWERAGSGSCVSGSALDGGGCLFLLSGDSDAGRAFFVDSDEEGQNVFLVTRAQLTPGDKDNKSDLYDIREGGGFPAAVEPSICGEAAGQTPCSRGTGSTESAMPSLTSGIFAGAGNIVAKGTPPPPPPNETEAQRRAKQLKSALATCHKKRNRKKRKACEISARHRFAPASAKKASNPHKKQSGKRKKGHK
jgi:hypothetical protein